MTQRFEHEIKEVKTIEIAFHELQFSVGNLKHIGMEYPKKYDSLWTLPVKRVGRIYKVWTGRKWENLRMSRIKSLLANNN